MMKEAASTCTLVAFLGFVTYLTTQQFLFLIICGCALLAACILNLFLNRKN